MALALFLNAAAAASPGPAVDVAAGAGLARLALSLELLPHPAASRRGSSRIEQRTRRLPATSTTLAVVRLAARLRPITPRTISSRGTGVKRERASVSDWLVMASQPAVVSGSPTVASASARETATDSARTYARAAASMMSVETP